MKNEFGDMKLKQKMTGKWWLDSTFDKINKIFCDISKKNTTSNLVMGLKFYWLVPAVFLIKPVHTLGFITEYEDIFRQWCRGFSGTG